MSKIRNKLLGRNRALILFTILVVFPGMALAVIGLRTVWQERNSSEERERERLGRAAEQAAGELARDIQWWQDRIKEIRFSTGLDAGSFPERMSDALAIPGGAVYLKMNSETVQAFPANQLLYYIKGKPASGDPPAEILIAQIEALRSNNYAAARSIYQRKIEASTDSRSRAWLLKDMAALERNAGHRDEAMRLYQELGRAAGITLGSLPADLISGFGVCSLFAEEGAPDTLAVSALDLHRSLVNGVWPLEKVRYSYYSEVARQWLESAALPLRQSSLELEDRKLALTRAVEKLAESWNPAQGLPASLQFTDAGANLAFWRTESAPLEAWGLVLSARYLHDYLWPRIFSGPAGGDAEFSLIAPDGKSVFSTAKLASSEVPDKFKVSRNIRISGSPWQLEIWPRRPDTIAADLNRRQYLYLGMLALMMASLIFGIGMSARTLRRELEVARLKSDFVSGVTHEFRSPLAGIRQLAELLISGRVPSEERKAEYYAMILRETLRLSGLVDNVLGFARATDRGNRSRLEVIETSVWLREIVERFRQSPAGGSATLSCSIQGNMPCLLADRETLSMAIGNLLDNAVKYSTGQIGIRLEAECQAAYIMIRVQDSGIGIAPEDQRHVFERFYRCPNELTRRVRGTGLGLSLAKEVVDSLGGEILLQSRPGAGSTFTIRLPVSEFAGNGEGIDKTPDH